jgi:hypothetical protein
MPSCWTLRVAGAAVLLAAFAATPALGDVRAGVDAWTRGDYAAAVREWEAPAAAGDADAMFNLGQAYRLGRGVPADLKRAEMLYAGAAAAGHLQAADTYGLLLYEEGRREAALPYVRNGARRGDARAQYLLGLAYFNGDLVEKDWPRAYALLTLASGKGLPQAAPAIAEMDRLMPLTQRQHGAALAIEMRNGADAARAPAPEASTPAASGPWRIQLGAFSVTGNAERLWRELRGRSELSGTERLLVPAGRLMQLQAAGFATRPAAEAACRSLRQSGHECLVTDR